MAAAAPAISAVSASLFSTGTVISRKAISAVAPKPVAMDSASARIRASTSRITSVR